MIGKQSALSRVVKYILTVIVFVIFAFPVYWILTLSLKRTEDAWTNPKWFLFIPTLQQYQDLLNISTRGVPFLAYYRNSLIVVVGALLISLVLAVPLAYALARFDWKMKKDISFFVLSQLMLPPAAVVVPFYLLIQQVGLLRTLFAPMVVYVVFTLPFIAWMMKGFFEALPVSLEEAAMVDGCTRFEAFHRIVLPLVVGSLTSTTMLAAITAWNEFFFALVLTGMDTYTAPVGITTLWTDQAVYWGQIAAGGVLISLPIVIIGVLVQRYLVRGLTLGAVK